MVRGDANVRWVQVNLWGLDAIKTKGESVAVALYMVGARPVREGTGRIARCAARTGPDDIPSAMTWPLLIHQVALHR